MPYDCRESEDNFGDNNVSDSGRTIGDKDVMAGHAHTNLTNALREYLKVCLSVEDKEILENTPHRFVMALWEMTKGKSENPKIILEKVFNEVHDELVIVKEVPFSSVCSHHLLPFMGTADIGYIPGKVVGLSKLARLLDCFSRRLQMQERITKEVAEAIMLHLEAKGAAVVTRATHTCMYCRGVRKTGEMICSSMLGVFRDEPAARAEFLNLCRS